MADEEKQKEAQDEQKQQDVESKPEQKKEKPEDNKNQLLQWIILTVVVLILAIAGFFLGRTMGTVPQPAEAQTDGEIPVELKSDAKNKSDTATKDPGKMAGKGWYYDLDPVATNLSDPGATRYVRAVLTLEISREVGQAEGIPFLDERKPVISNILNIYFAGLTIEDINSDRDMRRIQYELVEIFNETLYDNGKPMVKQILFREFGLQ
jgi:flagellar basal body-associated protein FliL